MSQLGCVYKERVGNETLHPLRVDFFEIQALSLSPILSERATESEEKKLTNKQKHKSFLSLPLCPLVPFRERIIERESLQISPAYIYIYSFPRTVYQHRQSSLNSTSDIHALHYLTPLTVVCSSSGVFRHSTL